MQHFDDIPIAKIQKMPGYQTGAEMLTGGAQAATFDNLGPES